MTPRRALTILGLLFLAFSTFEPRLLQMPFADRAEEARALSPDRQWPSYPLFLDGVRARTTRGERIALLIPNMHWADRYDYAYYRASYFLAGREVLPLIDENDHPQPQNARAADVVAVFGGTLRGAPVLWRGEGGSLVRMPRP